MGPMVWIRKLGAVRLAIQYSRWSDVNSQNNLHETRVADDVPIVSVVIPTYRRPAEVQVAVHSALNQSYRQLEVVVVVDGPQPETENALRTIEDPRLRVVVNAENQGLAESRNVGVRAAKGEWLAFLDDDDSWFPTKIEKQLQAAQKVGRNPRIRRHAISGEEPGLSRGSGRRRLPKDTHLFSEYLFRRRGMLLPSTYMMSRALILDVPFTKGLRHIEDIDWLLRAAADPRTRIAVVPEPLAIYNNLVEDWAGK